MRHYPWEPIDDAVDPQTWTKRQRRWIRFKYKVLKFFGRTKHVITHISEWHKDDLFTK